MKQYNKITIFLLFLLGLSFSSCDGVLDLDLLDDPNNLTLDKADLDRYLNTIQTDFSEFGYLMGDNGAELTRINYMFGRTYINNFTAASSDTEWRLAYQNMFSDMKEAELLAIASESNKHIGVMKVLKAFVLLTLVDFYGDVPLSEATQPQEFPFPHADDGADVYQAVFEMLDSAIGFLQADGDDLSNDLYYDNDFDKWVKLANTLKMKAYVNTYLVDNNALTKFNTIVNSNNYISSSDDDFQFRYGTSVTSPNTRHDNYDSGYQNNGAQGGDYRSNWIMNQMHFDDDPRIRYYFYRQTHSTPGYDTIPGNPVDLTCSTQSRPPHFSTHMPYCHLPDGYWGRDHGNAEGIPPDNLERTLVGVYPAGGKFDNLEIVWDAEAGEAGEYVPLNPIAPANLDSGGQGAGITPLLLASWVDLMKAEVAMTTNPADGAAYLRASLEKSIAKVMTFGSLDPDAMSTYFPTGDDVTTFIDNIVGDFNAADTEGKWDIFANQYFIGQYGYGADAYNLYRRTGYPVSLQYNIEPNSGNFIRSFLYSANEANNNSNITQKENGDIQVFWDNNPPSPGFPSAN